MDFGIKYMNMIDAIYLSQFINKDKKPKFNYSEDGICKLFNKLKSSIYEFNKKNDGYNETDPIFKLDIDIISNLFDGIYMSILRIKQYSQYNEYIFAIDELFNICNNIVMDFRMISKYCYNSRNLYDIIKDKLGSIIKDFITQDFIEVISSSILTINDKLDYLDIKDESNSIIVNYKSFLVDKRNEILYR